MLKVEYESYQNEFHGKHFFKPKFGYSYGSS
jgi:hypothetical protein